MINLMHGDCLELMKEIPDGSVDLVLCDLPYGTTACKWDSVIPFEPLWEQYRRIAKKNAAIVLTASQPFTTALIASNYKMFKYCWVWEKTMGTNPSVVKFQPFKKHEDIVVFSQYKHNYYPQMEEGKAYVDNRTTERKTQSVMGESLARRKPIINKGWRYPSSVQTFKNSNHNSLHPTQKPVALMEYLIRTYTNGGDVVLDNCMGSGTTGVACKNLNRKFIGIERDEEYFKIAKNRIENHIVTLL